MKDNFEETIEYVVSVLKDAGYEPYEQLLGYVSTGNELFITRHQRSNTVTIKLKTVPVDRKDSTAFYDWIADCSRSTV